ncbi:MAG: regulatory protein RecX [bacterium]|nr:regulatory protein RecX [bacterium]
MDKNIKLTIQQSKPKIEYFCNYQERCQSEVKDKLYSFGLNTDDVNELLAHVVTSGLVNEERFAILFAGGKFRQKQWGRGRIKQELKFRKISDYSIKKALNEIDDEAYIKTLEKVAEKYYATLKDKLKYIKEQKLIKYLNQKGFEYDLIQDYLKKKLD